MPQINQPQNSNIAKAKAHYEKNPKAPKENDGKIKNCSPGF